MSIWSERRKRAVQPKSPRFDPKADLENRVAWRICAIVYGGGGTCDCAQRGRGQTCENMLLAAQHVMQEIMQK